MIKMIKFTIDIPSSIIALGLSHILFPSGEKEQRREASHTQLGCQFLICIPIIFHNLHKMVTFTPYTLDGS